MAKYYYNGVLLPAIPVVEGYPYWVVLCWTNGNKQAIGSKNGFYFNGQTLISDKKNEVLKAYNLKDDIWEVDTNQNDKYSGWTCISNGVSVLQWSTHDIPNGSETATDIYFRGSFPTVTPIHLVNQNQSSSNGVTSCSLTMTGCAIGNTLILAYAVRGDGNDPTLTDGWEKVGGGNVDASDGNLYHKLYFATKKVENTTETVTLTQTSTGRIYLVCGEFSGEFSVVMRDDMANIGSGYYKVTANKSNANDVVLYGVTSSNYQIGMGRQQSCTPDDLTKLQGDSSEERLACWFDGGSGSLSHEFTTSNSSGTNLISIVECVQLLPKKPKYLVRNNNIIYTVQNDALVEVSGTLNADLFKTSGIDTIPNGVLLMTLSAPEVLCWTNADTLPTLTATIQGVPIGTHDIVSDDVCIGHESIYGMESVEAMAGDGATFLLSFDGGMWMTYTNGSWSASDVGMSASELVAIPAEAWQIMINSAQNMKLKAIIDGENTVTQVKFNFNNTPPV